MIFISLYQQHGSVYWKQGSEAILMNLDPGRFAFEQLKDCFSVQDSPVWMDSSTSEYCELLENRVGGAQVYFTIIAVIICCTTSVSFDFSDEGPRRLDGIKSL